MKHGRYKCLDHESLFFNINNYFFLISGSFTFIQCCYLENVNYCKKEITCRNHTNAISTQALETVINQNTATINILGICSMKKLVSSHVLNKLLRMELVLSIHNITDGKNIGSSSMICTPCICIGN